MKCFADTVLKRNKFFMEENYMLSRPRRLCVNCATRILVRETKLNIEDLIYS